MALLCIDIGNTHTHLGLVHPDGTITAQTDVPTRAIDHPVEGLTPILQKHLPQTAALAFCSVVPTATHLLRRLLSDIRYPHDPFHLTHEKQLGIPINYPRPDEIGQDRLADAAAANQLSNGAPSIVIDLGTAVTFDIVTKANGYEGGIIAPGIDVMRNYLHERTAQLPLLDDTLPESPAMIGTSTTAAMRIGVTVGFTGMIQALLDQLLGTLSARNEPPSQIFLTGGTARYVQKHLRQKSSIVPELTLIGLATTYNLNSPAAK